MCQALFQMLYIGYHLIFTITLLGDTIINPLLKIRKLKHTTCQESYY